MAAAPAAVYPVCPLVYHMRLYHDQGLYSGSERYRGVPWCLLTSAVCSDGPLVWSSCSFQLPRCHAGLIVCAHVITENERTSSRPRQVQTGSSLQQIALAAANVALCNVSVNCSCCALYSFLSLASTQQTVAPPWHQLHQHCWSSSSCWV